MGRIGAAHGIGGEVRIQSFTEEPLALAYYGPLATNRPGLVIEIESARATTNVLVARLKGIKDRTAAEKLNGVELYIDRDKLPPAEDDDDFYHADLIGLEARLSDGSVVGKVTAIPNFGASDLLEVRDERTGDTYLYPFTKAVVPDSAGRRGLPRHRDARRRRAGRGRARLSFDADVITLFPELFPGPLGASVIGRGAAEGLWSLQLTQLRDHATDKHRSVDDTPAGGGAGMVLKPDVLAAAIDSVSHQNDPRPRLLMSPRGTPLTQARARALAAGPGVVIVCGRFEGIDERVIEARNLEEISIGDYVLAGGEVAAMVLLEAVVRLIPGVLGKDESNADESFENGVLEYPQYTRPAQFEGRDIPAVLTSGDHGKVGQWRREQSTQADPRAATRSAEVVTPDRRSRRR